MLSPVLVTEDTLKNAVVHGLLWTVHFHVEDMI